MLRHYPTFFFFSLPVDLAPTPCLPPPQVRQPSTRSSTTSTILRCLCQSSRLCEVVLGNRTGCKGVFHGQNRKEYKIARRRFTVSLQSRMEDNAATKCVSSSSIADRQSSSTVKLRASSIARSTSAAIWLNGAAPIVPAMPFKVCA